MPSESTQLNNWRKSSFSGGQCVEVADSLDGGRYRADNPPDPSTGISTTGGKWLTMADWSRARRGGKS